MKENAKAFWIISFARGRRKVKFKPKEKPKKCRMQNAECIVSEDTACLGFISFAKDKIII